MKRKVLFLFAMLAIMSQSLFAQAPDWEPVTGLEHNLNIIAKVQINDVPPTFSVNPLDVVGAFVGNDNDVRGVGHPLASGLVFITVQSDNSSGDLLYFKVWIEEEDVIYAVEIYQNMAATSDPDNAMSTLEFNASLPPDAYGTADAPMIFVLTPVTYTIMASRDPDDDNFGAITPAGTTTLNQGQSQEYTITPAVGHHIVSVIVDNGDNYINYDVFDGDENEVWTHTISNIQHNWTIVANFAINTYNLSFTAGPNGTLTGPDPDDLLATLTDQASLTYTDIEYDTDLGEITAVPNSGDFAFVMWDDDETATATRDINPVNEDITATATFALDGWTPGTGYNNTMTVIGNIFIDGTLSTDPNDMVGAFINDECRGIAHPNATNGLVFLSIGSNTTGVAITLKIFDNSTGSICEADFSYAFANNLEVGSIDDPEPIACKRELGIEFLPGYTWFSTNIRKGTGANPWLTNPYFGGSWYDGPDYGTLGGGPTANDRIIGQTQFAVYTTLWIGSLTEMNPKLGYRYYNSSSGPAISRYMHLVGSAVNSETITLNPGFTWLGYTPGDPKAVNEALAGLTGMANNDRIIGQNSFAAYNATLGWVGSLTTMYPGKGYVIKLVNGGTLTYPEDTYNRSFSMEGPKIDSPAGFEVSEHMKNTMMLIGKFDTKTLTKNDVIYAFIDGECRGIAKTDEYGNIFMSIGENTEEAKDVSFKVWFDDKGELANIDQTLTFVPMKEVGDLQNPFKFSISESGTTNSWLIGKAYPNPFNDQTIIPLWLKESAKVSLNVYNNMGQLVKNINISATKTGAQNLVLQKDQLMNGVYYYTISIESDHNNMLETGKLIIQ